VTDGHFLIVRGGIHVLIKTTPVAKKERRDELTAKGPIGNP